MPTYDGLSFSKGNILGIYMGMDFASSRSVNEAGICIYNFAKIAFCCCSSPAMMCAATAAGVLDNLHGYSKQGVACVQGAMCGSVGIYSVGQMLRQHVGLHDKIARSM